MFCIEVENNELTLLRWAVSAYKRQCDQERRDRTVQQLEVLLDKIRMVEET